MKKNVFLLVMILVLPLFLQSPVHATLTAYYSESSAVVTNYANLYYPNLYGGTVGVGNTVGTTVPVADGHSYTADDEFTTMWGQDTGHSGVTFTGTGNAASGISDGVLYSSGYTSMTYTGFTGSSTDTPGVAATQKCVATFTQYYVTSVRSAMEISGSLDLGTILFDLLDSDVLSDYSISASVAVNQSTFTSGSTGGNTSIAYLELSADNLSDSAVVTLLPGTLGVAGTYYYSVTTTLVIQASLDNHELTSGVVTADAFDGSEFIIGDSDNPIMLTAAWSPVPVPSSLFLLISGAAGISFIRRRRS